MESYTCNCIVNDESCELGLGPSIKLSQIMKNSTIHIQP